MPISDFYHAEQTVGWLVFFPSFVFLSLSLLTEDNDKLRMETVSNDPSGKVFRIHMYICINRRVGYMCVSAAIILDSVRFSFLSSIFSFLISFFFSFFSLFLFKIMRLYILRFRKLLFLHLLQSIISKENQ